MFDIYVVMIMLGLMGSPLLLPLGWLLLQGLNRLQSARYLSSWHKFALAHGLNFKQMPGSSSWNLAAALWPYVEGDYGGHHLSLRSYSQGLDTIIELTLAVMPDGTGATSAEEELKWLNAMNWSSLRGWLSAEPGGQTLRYRQGSFEGDSQRLKGLADLLVRIAAAYPSVLQLGTQAVPALQPLAAALEYRNFPVRALIRQLLEDIAQDTYTRLGRQPNRVLCRQCLTQPVPYQGDLSAQGALIFYGCRICGQSRDFLNGQVVAVLDAGMEADHLERDDRVEVNWLRVQAPFDFERVEIRQASDEQVERFVMQIGNDTDSFRRARYRKIECTVAPGCHLSVNSLRILERFLGRVHVLALSDRERLRSRLALEQEERYDTTNRADFSPDSQDLGLG